MSSELPRIVALWLFLLRMLGSTEDGIAVHYDPNVMQNVVENRRAGKTTMGLPPPGDEVGYVARLECEEVGDYVFLKFSDTQVLGPFLVADCAAPGDKDRIAGNDIVVELQWSWAVKVGLDEVGRMPVKVYYGGKLWQQFVHDWSSSSVYPSSVSSLLDCSKGKYCMR